MAAFALASTWAWCGQEPRQQNKQEGPQETFPLYRAETIDFSAPPPIAVATRVLCDASGNIYASYSASLPSSPIHYGLDPLRGIFPAAKSVIQYLLPAVPEYRPLSAASFAVSPRGTVYALAATIRSEPADKPKPAIFIVKYKDDGTVDSYVKVGDEPDRRIQPARMAVFGDGDFLLSGTAVLDDGLGTFAGIFDRQGTFVTPLEFGQAIAHRGERPTSGSSEPSDETQPSEESHVKRLEADAKDPVGLASSTLSFGLQDGNVYVLQGTSEATLYVVSPAGYIIRKYSLTPPEPGMTPLQMAPAGVGYLFIYYGRMGVAATAESPAQPDYIAVLNSETGQETAIYSMRKDERGLVIPACAESPHNFLFLAISKDQHLEVTRYVAR
jgi:hypothetical protein